MTSLKAAAEEFLAQERIAVAGVSRDEKQPANLIYRRVIPGGCPNMFGETSDPGHRCVCALLRWTGKIPKEV
jgi:hypothetical protein